MLYTNRRKWFKQVGLTTLGFSLTGITSLAAPLPELPVAPLPGPGSPIRLSANENPYGPSPMARAAMAESIDKSNRYGFSTVSDLVSAIANYHALTYDNVLTAAGSTEILTSLGHYFGKQKGSYVVAEPSFNNWTKLADKAGIKKIAVPLTADKRHDFAAMLKAIKPDTRFIYICNPNNPTGTLSDRNALLSFITAASKMATVIVDEAYLDFTDQQSVCSLVADNKKLIVVKTFSKIYGLAGARTGYALGHKQTIEELQDLMIWPGGDTSVMSRAAAIASLQDTAFVTETRSRNELAKAYTEEQLKAVGISVIPSHTNFIYLSLTNYKKDYFKLLESANIEGTGIYEEEGKWTRISIGTMEEMKRFVEVIG